MRETYDMKVELSVSLRQAGLRQGWTVTCTSVFTCCGVPQRKNAKDMNQNKNVNVSKRMR